MPELPEVETIRLGLQKYLVGHTIKKVEVRLPRLVNGDTKHVIGMRITGVRRFGKGLVIDGDNGYSIAAHVKLTGQFIYSDSQVTKHVKLSADKVGQIPNKWTHVIFKLKRQNAKGKSENAYLYYNDQRQFGWIKILKTEQVQMLPFFKELGPEPPVTDSSKKNPLTLVKFSEIIRKASGSIKPLLMDQKKIGGIGNIYANDALFDAGIDPRSPAKKLTKEETERLYDSILKVLKHGLLYRGASELNFVDALGEEGGYQKHFLVYGRKGKPCRICGRPIQKIILAGRGTYFCPNCQK